MLRRIIINDLLLKQDPQFAILKIKVSYIFIYHLSFRYSRDDGFEVLVHTNRTASIISRVVRQIVVTTNF